MARVKIDWLQHYKGRIEQIDIDIKKAIRKKDWTGKKKLETEKKIWEEKIRELEGEQS